MGEKLFLKEILEDLMNDKATYPGLQVLKSELQKRNLLKELDEYIFKYYAEEGIRNYDDFAEEYKKVKKKEKKKVPLNYKFFILKYAVTGTIAGFIEAKLNIELYEWVETVLPADGEWWNSSSKDAYIRAAKTLISRGVEYKLIKEILDDLYTAGREEFGD